jgi:hypothetical protein
MTTMPLGSNTLKMTNVGYQGLTQSIASTRLSSTCLRRNLHDGVTCTTHRRASASLKTRLGNPRHTCFHLKQGTRSRCVSHADLPPLVLWRNRQTEAHLVLRSKPRNHRSDFEVQIIKQKLPVLRLKPVNPPPALRPNWRKPSPPVLRPN